MSVDMKSRAHPGPFIEWALEEWRKNGLDKIGGIVEIGCMRAPLTHSLTDGSICDSCSDGHSTAHFAKERSLFFRSIDNSMAHCKIAGEIIHTPGIIDHMNQVVCYDGVEFMRTFGSPVSFLFLDAWDLDLPDSAEKHLECFKTSIHCLTDKCIVLIDDTDLVYVNGGFQHSNGSQGKGELMIPYAESIGFRKLWDGRTTCLMR